MLLARISDLRETNKSPNLIGKNRHEASSPHESMNGLRCKTHPPLEAHFTSSRLPAHCLKACFPHNMRPCNVGACASPPGSEQSKLQPHADIAILLRMHHSRMQTRTTTLEFVPMRKHRTHRAFSSNMKCYPSNRCLLLSECVSHFPAHADQHNAELTCPNATAPICQDSDTHVLPNAAASNHVSDDETAPTSAERLFQTDCSNSHSCSYQDKPNLIGQT